MQNGRQALLLLIAAGLAGCATPGRTIGLAIGAALIAGAAHHDHEPAARPDVPTPSDPCSTNRERCQ
jgi:hypothetical protein